MNFPTPLVTVVVPSFNEAPQIVRTSLESIRAQTFTDFECIVVDESTRPELAEACRAVCAEDPRFIYIHPNVRLGLPRSLNLAIGKARGQLIARFDSDDVCMPDRLEHQVAFMAENSDIGVLGGGLEIIGEDGGRLAFRDYPASHADIERNFQTTNAIAHPTVMVRKRVFDAYGSYLPEYHFSEDLELWLRLLNHGVRFANLQGVLVRYRQQSTRRSLGNWRFNIRARIRNFSSRHLPLRVVGILAIFLWSCLPGSVHLSS